MTRTIYISLALFLVLSCSNHEKTQRIDWSQELIGIGYMGESPDSLEHLFSYYPYTNNQLGKFKELFKYKASISGDTIIIPNHLLRSFYLKRNIDNEIIKDTSTFLITLDKSLFRLTKLKGYDFIPQTIYFDKSPSKIPNSFSYFYVHGFDLLGQFKIDILEKDTLNVWLESGSYTKYLYEQYEMNEIDELFISSYLNLVVNGRYDTISFSMEGSFFCGSSMQETLVYNDSLFIYDTHFRRVGSGHLVDYFRTKIDSNLYILEEVDSDVECPFNPKNFDKLPVAVEDTRDWE